MRRLLILLGVAVSLAPARALAYARSTAGSSSQVCTWWYPRQVHYLINAKGVSSMDFAALQGALEAGFGAWVGWDCSDFTYVDDGTTDSVQVGYDRVLISQPDLAPDVANLHLVVFREQPCSAVAPPDDDCFDEKNSDCDNKYDCWDDGQNTSGDAVALTLVTSQTTTGEILDADTALDAVDFQFKDVTVSACDADIAPEACEDVQNTMAHEAGHFLGLAHSQDPDATMYFQVESIDETTKRDVNDDDIDGLCAIYPRGQPAVTCVTLPGKVVTGEGCASAEGAPWLALLAVAFVAKRRRVH